MNSRERVLTAVVHKVPDRVPIDLGSTPVTGIAASTLWRVERALGIIDSSGRVKVNEPFQMLGEVSDKLREAFGIDCVGIGMTRNHFGFKNENWKPWVLFDGTPVLVPGKFNTDPEPNGDILQYPEGDKSAPPSGRMPKDGFYFDAIIRQDPIDDDKLNVEDNLEEFGPVSDEDLRHLETTSLALRRETDLAIVGTFGGTSFGDIALVPGLQLKHPKGIRDVEEWYVSTVTRRNYIREIFERQCSIALDNLALIQEAVDDRVDIIFVTGTDFGTQVAPFISPDTYRELFQPFHKRVNDWVHENTGWKTFIHSCGSVEALIEDFIDAGFDILNPVQTSAADMEPEKLKRKYGDRITFWGGGVDTQHTLPFATPEEVEREVKERITTFGKGGGYVFNPVHNIQAGCPAENVIRAFQTAKNTHID